LIYSQSENADCQDEFDDFWEHNFYLLQK